MKCPNCNTEFDWGKFCPNCGTECVETPEETVVSSEQAADLTEAEAVQQAQIDQESRKAPGMDPAQEMEQNPYQNPYQQNYQGYQQPYRSMDMPGYAPATPPMTNSGMGIASLVLGITSLTGLGAVFIPSILGLIFGIVGKRDKQHKTELATVGIVLSVISIILWIAIYVWLIGLLVTSPYFLY